MHFALVMHIIAGTLGLVSGYVALAAAKGMPLHRRSGKVFVAVMLTMSLTGLTIAAVRGVAPAINIPAALLTGYLVATALSTLRPPSVGIRRLELGGLLLAFGVGLVSLVVGMGLLAGGGRGAGMAFPLFMFSSVALTAGIGDLKWRRSDSRHGATRLARHLWRMCFALYIAAASFFLGQADELPVQLRIPALLAVPVLVPLVAMCYWLWRLRGGRKVGDTAARGRRGWPARAARVSRERMFHWAAGASIGATYRSPPPAVRQATPARAGDDGRS